MTDRQTYIHTYYSDLIGPSLAGVQNEKLGISGVIVDMNHK